MEKVFVGRQPIYDREMGVFAYEILYRSGNVAQAGVFDGEKATSQVLLNSFLEIGFARLTDGRPAFFNMTRDFLLKEDLDLPRDQVVLEVLETVAIDDTLVQAVQRLSRSGYRIALDDFAFEPRWEPLLKLADFVKVEVPAIKPEEARQKLALLRRYKAKLLAEKVETHEEYERFKKLGCHYFQGYFFSKPKVIESKSVSANRLGIIRLMAKVQSPETNVGELEKIIRGDPSLSYKLLRYLNSPGFGMRHKVTSILQAVTYLGIRTLRTWITLIAMAGVEGKTSELAVLAMQRGRKAELLAKALKLPDTDQFFLAGILSVLDAMMDMPMEDLVRELPLPEEVVVGLMALQGRVGEVLKVVYASEKGDWETALAGGRWSEEVLGELFMSALFWADEQMRAIRQ